MTEAEKAAKSINDNIDILKAKIENGATKEELQTELTAIKEANKDLISKSEYAKLEDIVKTMGETITELKERTSEDNSMKKGYLSNHIEENVNKAKGIESNDKDLKDYKETRLTVKAADLMTTANVKPVSGGAFSHLFNNYIDTEVGYTAKPDNFILNLVSVTTQPSTEKIWWAERENEEGDAKFVSEGELAPLADGEYQEKNEDMYEAAVAWKFSKRLLTHAPSIESDFRSHMDELVDQKIDNNVLSGDNSVNPKEPNGITTVAGAFIVPPSLADYYTSSNIYDVINASSTRIRLNNFKGQITAVLGTVWEAKMKGIKNENGDYILPHFVSPDGKTVGSVNVTFQNKMPEDQILIGDLKKFNVVMGDDFEYSEFHENDDQRKRLITKMIDGEYGTYMKGTDAGAIIYNSIADIQTQIDADLV